MVGGRALEPVGAPDGGAVAAIRLYRDGGVCWDFTKLHAVDKPLWAGIFRRTNRQTASIGAVAVVLGGPFSLSGCATGRYPPTIASIVRSPNSFSVGIVDAAFAPAVAARL
jgi:hypothetical protein